MLSQMIIKEHSLPDITKKCRDQGSTPGRLESFEVTGYN